MAAWRIVRTARPVTAPRRILIVQLDHLGDSVLTSPLVAQLRRAYPAATIDVLASPSNHEVFEADPDVNQVRIAERTWFERHPSRWGLLGEVWRLGRSIRSEKYDLGIDVRGDVLSVLVLALGGIPRRVGWAMGGGAFLLTDIADWVRGRHEVRARLALLDPLGIARRRTAAGRRPCQRSGPGNRGSLPGRGLAQENALDGSRSRSVPAGGAVRTIAASCDSPPPGVGREPPIPTGCTQVGSALIPLFWRSILVPARRPSAGRSGTGTRSSSDSSKMAGAWSSWAGRKTRPRPRCLLVTSGCATGPAGSRSLRPRPCWNGPTCSSAPIPGRPTWPPRPAHCRSSSSAEPTSHNSGGPGPDTR